MSLGQLVISVVLIICLSLFSCNKTEDFQNDYQYEYYPLDSGATVIYRMDSININGNFKPLPAELDTFVFDIKEIVGDTFIDLEGEVAYNLWRFRKLSDDSVWGIPKRWHIKRTLNGLEMTEQNLRFVKLLFPPEEKGTWEGNQFITITDEQPELKYMEDWEEYTYKEVGVTGTVNGMNFGEILTVGQFADSNRVEKIVSREIYAKNVGMIYKEIYNLKAQGAAAIALEDWNNSDKWTEDGFILKMRITSFKN